MIPSGVTRRSLHNVMKLPNTARAVRLAVLAASITASTVGQQFIDATASSGINVPGSTSVVLGRGAAIADFNGDGLTDVIFPGASGQPFKAYLNLGGMTFIDVAPTSNLGLCADMKGMAVADYDNDGDIDLFTCVRNGPNRLYRNNGMMVFDDVAPTLGLDWIDQSTVATWGDYDNDGDVDLYVGTRKMPDAPGCNRLYRNDGTVFTETTMAAGVDHGSMTFACMFMDYDRDGWQDLWVTSDQAYNTTFRKNAVYRNNHDGTFTDVSLTVGAQIAMQAMGVDFSDVNNDGRLAVYMSNTSISMGNSMGNPNTDGHVMLHWNPLLSQFIHVEQAWGTRLNDIGWANIFLDYDNDGREDLFVKHMASPNAVLRNTGALPWQRLSPAASGFTMSDPDVAAGIGDFDNDGFMDIVEPKGGCPSMLMRNTGGNANHWLKIKLEGRESNRSGLGAEVRFLTYADGIIRTRFMKSGNGMMVANEPVVHVGLAGNSLVNVVQIRWPSGQIQNLINVSVDQTLTVVEPILLLAESVPGGLRPWTLDAPSDAGLPYIIAVSASTTPGVALGDGRSFPLAWDGVFEASLAQGSVFSPQNVGALDAVGRQVGHFWFPQIPILNGITLHTAALTVDQAASAWVRNIFGPFPIQL